MEAPISPASAQKTNVLSIVSLVTGIIGFLSICAVWIPVFGMICLGLFGLAGIITGFIGLNQVKNRMEKGKGMAIAGIILGVLSLLGLCISLLVPSILTLLGPSIGNIFSDINSQLIP